MMIISLDSTNYEIYEPAKHLFDDCSDVSIAYSMGVEGYGETYEDATEDLKENIVTQFNYLYNAEPETLTESETRQLGWMKLHIREKE